MRQMSSALHLNPANQTPRVPMAKPLVISSSHRLLMEKKKHFKNHFYEAHIINI